MAFGRKAVLQLSHNRAEGYALRTIAFGVFLNQGRGCLVLVGAQFGHGIGSVLDGIGEAIRFVEFHDAVHFMVHKKARGHDVWNVLFLHPYQPFAADIQVNFYGNVVDYHRVNLGVQR